MKITHILAVLTLISSTPALALEPVTSVPQTMADEPATIIPAPVRYGFVYHMSELSCPAFYKSPEKADPFFDRITDRMGLNKDEGRLLLQFCMIYGNGLKQGLSE